MGTLLHAEDMITEHSSRCHDVKGKMHPSNCSKVPLQCCEDALHCVAKARDMRKGIDEHDIFPLNHTLASSSEAPRCMSTSKGADFAAAGFSKETFEGFLTISFCAGPEEPRLARSDPSRWEICNFKMAQKTLLHIIMHQNPAGKLQEIKNTRALHFPKTSPN